MPLSGGVALWQVKRSSSPWRCLRQVAKKERRRGLSEMLLVHAGSAVYYAENFAGGNQHAAVIFGLDQQLTGQNLMR